MRQIEQWLRDELKIKYDALLPASADASFRRYFRIFTKSYPGHTSLIIMDAPPDKEDSRPFVAINIVLDSIGVNVPEILELNLDHGFMLLEDFGKRQLLSELNSDNVDKHYGDALNALALLQSQSPRESDLIPDYSLQILKDEMELFRDWLLARHYKVELDDYDAEIITAAFDFLAQEAYAQPKVLVHRDYHSRNLMVLEEDSPGIIDFQDAVIGPVSYDVVSLLRDCYIEWPQEQVEQWVIDYFARPEISQITASANHETVIRWFDLMGVQRHLKASGIFARLFYRDGKAGYLKDIPRTLNYIAEVISKYEDLEAFNELFLQKITPCYIKDHEKIDWSARIKESQGK